METSLNWKGTKGKWFRNESLSEQNEHGAYQLATEVSRAEGSDENATRFIIVYDDDPIKLKANFELIIDAGNTRQECDLMPSQLKEKWIANEELANAWIKEADLRAKERDKLGEENTKLKEALKIALNYMEVFMIRGEEPLVGENLKTDLFTIRELLNS